MRTWGCMPSSARASGSPSSPAGGSTSRRSGASRPRPSRPRCRITCRPAGSRSTLRRCSSRATTRPRFRRSRRSGWRTNTSRTTSTRWPTSRAPTAGPRRCTRRQLATRVVATRGGSTCSPTEPIRNCSSRCERWPGTRGEWWASTASPASRCSMTTRSSSWALCHRISQRVPSAGCSSGRPPTPRDRTPQG
jgi:hypothetical protein